MGPETQIKSRRLWFTFGGLFDVSTAASSDSFMPINPRSVSFKGPLAYHQSKHKILCQTSFQGHQW